MITARVFIILMLCSWLLAIAGESTITAMRRTNGINFKDRALASCISEAYKGSPGAEDANITVSVYLEWTYYDFKNGDPAIDLLVDQYLHRDYSTPVEGYADAKFNLLKCLDMYHSHELDKLMRKYVPHPDWVGDKPAKRKRK